MTKHKRSRHQPYVRKCRVCRCSEFEPCNPPCAWSKDPTLCTTCVEMIVYLQEWLESAHRANFSALEREARKNWAPGDYKPETARIAAAREDQKHD
jgi:hypothetical protein